MGNVMGDLNGRSVGLSMDDQPTFDPHDGFTYKRKKREMTVPDEFLRSAKVPIKYRDYCSGPLLDYQVCRYKNMPFLYRCAHERHHYLNCEKDDYVIRMKEFERERRLRERQVLLGESALP